MKAANLRCDRCAAEAGGLGSSALCICGPNVPCDWCGQGVTPSAPSGDHGGLRGAVEMLADEWEGPVSSYEVQCIRARYAKMLRELLAAHPVPEPAQDGEARDRAVAALIAELGDYADGWPDAEAAEEFWGKAVDTVLAVAAGVRA